MNGDLLNDWLMEIWHPNVCRCTGENVCLISANVDALPRLDGVEYAFLPPNGTSVYQPMDRGILIAVKTHARSRMLRTIISNLDSYDELRALGSKQRDGMTGLRYAYPAHMLDAIQCLNIGLSKVHPMHVANAWFKSSTLLPHQR